MMNSPLSVLKEIPIVQEIFALCWSLEGGFFPLHSVAAGTPKISGQSYPMTSEPGGKESSGKVEQG